MMNDVIENRLLSTWARLLPRAPTQLGAIHEADCELLPIVEGRILALTIDSIDEEVEIGLYRSPMTVGRIAATAALSDLAAVGADPIGLMLSVSLPRDNAEHVQEQIATGVTAACALTGTFILGGDTSESSRLRVSCVGVGTAPASGVLRRIGLQPGDRLYSSGLLGSGAALAAAALLKCGAAIDEDSFAPPSRIVHGRALRRVASACMDTSDGLFASIDQLARLNNVAIRLEPDLGAMLSPAAAQMRRTLGGVEAFPFLASTHGEFELVFGLPEHRMSTLDQIARSLDWRPIPIGVVKEGQGITIGETAVDGARIRNLYAECGDIETYVARLVSLGRTLGVG